MAFQQFPQKGGIPSGNTAARPTNPIIGDTFYDGTLGFLLIWEGTQWIPCSAPAAQPSITVADVGTNIAYGTVQASVTFIEGVTGGKAAGFTAIQGSTTQTSTSNPVVINVTGTPGSYTFTGTAYNGFGTSPVSPSASQTLTSLPQAPTIGTATASTTAPEITVTWTLGGTGGKNLSAITITPYLNGTTAQTSRTAATTSSTSYTFTSGQLAAGSSYTFKVTTTNANGTSLESAASNSATVGTFIAVDYLVVAGGGGGGSYRAGGGGAGGLRSTVTATGGGGSLETALNILPATNYTVTVGAGGAGGTGGRGTSGNNSVFGSITSTGGGGGGSADTPTAGATGGSGGGSAADPGNQPNTGGSRTASPVQGNNGGAANTFSTPYYGAGGGGGAGTSGTNGTTSTGGTGGNGVAVSITGTSVTYAGGGAGGGIFSAPSVNGGSGGGGNSPSNSNGGAGTANLGAGGGGANSTNDTTKNSGGAGGKGVVILRWLTSAGSITVGAGLTADATGTDGSYSYKRFTDGSGNVSIA